MVASSIPEAKQDDQEFQVILSPRRPGLYKVLSKNKNQTKTPKIYFIWKFLFFSHKKKHLLVI